MYINRNKIRDNILGEYFRSGKSMGKKNVKDFLKEYPGPYVSEESENSILYYIIKSEDKENILRVEQKQFPDSDWLS
jgi:hypothetical protein